VADSRKNHVNIRRLRVSGHGSGFVEPVAPVGNRQKRLIADVVHEVISVAFPDIYPNLCHAYAIVGSNVASIVLGRNYRPTAGLSIMDAGDGNFLALVNNTSFSNPVGGNYHCWILSCDAHPRNVELVDFTFRNNKAYADAHGMKWAKRYKSYLWGLEREVNLGGNPYPPPKFYEENQAWYRETPEGIAWMNCEVSANMDIYAKLTALALRYLRSQMGDESDAPNALPAKFSARYEADIRPGR
jgi:hypothetical protein